MQCVPSRLLRLSPLVCYDIVAWFQQKPKLYSRRLTSGQVGHAAIVCCSLRQRVIILKELTGLCNKATQHSNMWKALSDVSKPLKGPAKE